MNVVDNEFTMKMGNEVLMTVGKDEEIDSVSGGTVVHNHDHDDEYSTVDHTHLSFAKDVKFHKNVEIHGDLHVKGKVTVVKDLDEARKWIETSYNAPYKLWKTAMEKYEANPNDPTVVTYPLGDNTDVTNDEVPTENKYVWLGYIDSRKPTLGSHKDIAIKDMSYEALAQGIIGLGLNLQLLISPEANNYFALRPFYIDPEVSQAMRGLVRPFIKEYLEKARIISSKDINSVTKQSLDFTISVTEYANQMYKDHNMLTPFIVYLRYQGISPYSVHTSGSNQFLSDVSFGIKNFDYVQDALKSQVDTEVIVKSIEKIPFQMKEYIENFKSKGSTYHDYHYSAKYSKMGYDKVNTLDSNGNVIGTEALDEDGLPKWVILNNKEMYSKLKFSPRNLDNFDDILNGTFGESATFGKLSRSIYRTRYAGSGLRGLEEYLSEEQKTRIDNVIRGPLANVVSEIQEFMEYNRGNAPTDDFTSQWRCRINENIQSLDKENHRIVMEDGTFINFDDDRIFSVVKSIDQQARMYLAAFSSMGYLSKKDPNKTYNSITDIITNYESKSIGMVDLTKSMIMGTPDPNGNVCALEALTTAGESLKDLYDDLKKYNLTKAYEAGLVEGNISDVNFNVMKEVNLKINEVIKTVKIKSDWSQLGYHYGLPLDAPDALKNAYNSSVRSAPPTAAERATQLDSFGKPKFDGKFPDNKKFQYIVREHYKIDETTGIPLGGEDGKYTVHEEGDSTWRRLDDEKNVDYIDDNIEGLYDKDPSKKKIAFTYQNMKYMQKYVTWVANAVINTLYYENGGQAASMNIYPQEVVDKFRQKGIMAYTHGGSFFTYNGYGEWVDGVNLTIEDMMGSTPYTDADVFYNPLALHKDSPSGGKCNIFIGTRINTTNPQNMFVEFEKDMGIILHEGLIGHGFEIIVKGYNGLDRTARPKVGWASNSSFSGYLTDLNHKTTGRFSSQAVDIDFFCYQFAINFEGWAAYGELATMDKGIYKYVNFENCKLDLDGPTDYKAILQNLGESSRFAARLIGSARHSYPPKGGSCAKITREFAENMGTLNVSYATRFWSGGVLQQATYATGMIQSLEVVGLLQQKLGSSFDQKKFNLWRVEYNFLFADAFKDSALKLADEGYFTK